MNKTELLEKLETLNRDTFKKAIYWKDTSEMLYKAYLHESMGIDLAISIVKELEDE